MVSFVSFPLNYIFTANVAAILAIAFWIWMIIDCSKRIFKNQIEKIVWLLVVVIGQMPGAVIYFIVVYLMNKKGIYKK